MNIEKLKKELQGLTPIQKLGILRSLFKREKNEESRKRLFLFIEKAEKEKQLFDEELRNLESSAEQQEEEPLENIVEQTIEENPELKKDEKKPTEIYGIDNIEKNIQYLSPAEREKTEYKFESSGLQLNKFQEERILDESKRLEKEKKKYETGIS